MSCGCGIKHQRTFEAEVKLWSEMNQGIPVWFGIYAKAGYDDCLRQLRSDDFSTVGGRFETSETTGNSLIGHYLFSGSGLCELSFWYTEYLP